MGICWSRVKFSSLARAICFEDKMCFSRHTINKRHPNAIGEEVESSGFHLLEIHIPTAGLSAFIFLGVLALLLVGYLYIKNSKKEGAKKKIEEGKLKMNKGCGE